MTVWFIDTFRYVLQIGVVGHIVIAHGQNGGQEAMHDLARL